jgi:hypothetical protein
VLPLGLALRRPFEFGRQTDSGCRSHRFQHLYLFLTILYINQQIASIAVIYQQSGYTGGYGPSSALNRSSAIVAPEGASVAADLTRPTPHTYFRRWIEGSDFSLEANTPAAPRTDRFYVLVAGEVRLDTHSYAAAAAEYEGLCVAHWEAQLTHNDRSTRLLAARALLRHDREHPVARELLTLQGDERDRAAVARARQHAAFLSRKQR